MRSDHLLTALALAQSAFSLTLSTPKPTSTNDAHVQESELRGWSPKPTSNPRAYDLGVELRRRDMALPRTCGWVVTAGDSTAVTCPVGTCVLFTPSGMPGMAGCCTKYGGTMDWQSCDWAATCYDFTDIESSKCGAACQRNDFVRACTNAASPYCLSWTYPGSSVEDYGCGTDAYSTWETVYPKVADYSETATASLPYAPQAAITGYTNIPSGTGVAAASSRTSSSRGSVSTSSSYTSYSTSSSKKISTTVIIVIVVVVVAFLLIVAALVAFFCIRSRKSRRAWAATNNNTGGASAMSAVPNQPPIGQAVPPQQTPQGYYADPTQTGPQDVYAGGAAAVGGTAYSKASEAAGHPQPGYLQPQPGSPQLQPLSPATNYSDPARPYSPATSPAPSYGQPYYAPVAPGTPQQRSPGGAYSQPQFAAEAPDTSVARHPNGGPIAELG